VHHVGFTILTYFCSLSLVYLTSSYQQQMLCGEKFVDTMNWKGYGRVLVQCIVLSLSPSVHCLLHRWEGKKSLCDGETDILYVEPGYSFYACTFYVQS
jgi:hypothetical protein